MSLSPPTTRSRKRIRQINFDLNRSTPQLVRKLPKPNTPLLETVQVVREMTQQGEDQIRDLSKTIMSNVPSRAQGSNPGTTEMLAQGTSKQALEGKTEMSIRRIVDQSVGAQMAEMKKVIADLTSTVGKLSLVVQQTQQDQKKIMENNLPITSKTSNASQDQMETSEMHLGSNNSSRLSSINGRDQHRAENRPRVDKWGVEFDGDQNKLAVEDFVFRVERLQNRYGVPWGEVLDNFHLLVKGPAEKWYWLFIQTNYVSEWTTLKQALLKQYQATRSSFELMRDMVERRQLPGETIDAFFFAMMQLRSRLTISMPETEMIKMIKKNLREGIGRIVYPMSVSSVEELKSCCLDAEKTFLRREVKSHQMPVSRFTRQVNELYEETGDSYRDEELEAEEVAEVRANLISSQTTGVLKCWNCRQNGHVFMDCPSDERSIFCYRCGKPDVTSPNCSNCRNRNFRKNDGRAGDHRSAANPQ